MYTVAPSHRVSSAVCYEIVFSMVNQYSIIVITIDVIMQPS